MLGYSTLRRHSLSLSLYALFFSSFPLSLSIFQPLPSPHIRLPPYIWGGRFVYRACTCTVADLAVDDVISGVCSFDLDKRGSCLLPPCFFSTLAAARNCLRGSFSGDFTCLLLFFFKFLFVMPLSRFLFLSLLTVHVATCFNCYCCFVWMGRVLIMHNEIDLIMFIIIKLIGKNVVGKWFWN